MNNIILEKGFLIYYLLIYSICVRYVQCLYLTNLIVPSVADFREKAKLSCTYEIGNHKLNSVKWYKDGLEFFRYSPMMSRPFLIFEVNGTNFTSRDYFCNQFICNVELNNLTNSSSGAYRCEVSGDAPEFKLASQQSRMTVGVLPKHDPIITGLMSVYQVGDVVSVNCKSDWSLPPPSLSWYINDEQVNQAILEPQHELNRFMKEFTVYSRSIELRFTIDLAKLYTSDGKLLLRCSSDIMRIPSLRKQRAVKTSIYHNNNVNNEKLINNGATINALNWMFAVTAVILISLFIRINRFDYRSYYI